MTLQASLKGELEAHQQQLESSKVAQPALHSKAEFDGSRFWSHTNVIPNVCAFRSRCAS